MEQYFTTKELLETIIEHLENFSGDYQDLHSEIFNTDYYIIGYYEAEQALIEYGVFDAIEKIVEFEKANFGEIYTDLTSSESVANILWYILGEELMIELDLMDLDGPADDETNQELIERLQAELESEMD